MAPCTAARKVPALLAVAALGLGGCTGDGLHDAPGGDRDEPRGDGASGSDTDPAGDPDPGGDSQAGGASDPGVSLPPCVKHCDRVLDCAVPACVGIDWTTAGIANRACADVCDDDVAAAASALDCQDLLDAVMAASPSFAALCTSTPCELTCDYLADCALSECPAIGQPERDAIATDCRGWCDPATTAGDILSISCTTLIDNIAAGDPAFATFCEGAPGCPSLASCEPWATKVTGCMIDHCGGNIDPYATGLDELLVTYCATAADCPRQADVDAMLDPGFTCDTPGLAEVGPAPPFTAMCDGSLPVTDTELRAACEALQSCDAGLSSIDACRVSLALAASPDVLTACIDGAADCPAAFACLGGP